MEQLVARKLEEMKIKILKWDPDVYTVEAIAKAAEADGAHQIESNRAKYYERMDKLLPNCLNWIQFCVK